MATTVNVRFTAEDRRQQILEAAMELFGVQGYLGTTTRQIAEVAGVNEAIIFRHFPTKEELYWEVLDRKIRDGQASTKIAERLRSGATQREVFAGIGRDFLERRAKDPSVMRMLLFTALENHKLSSRFFHTHISDIYEMLADYIRTEIEAGRFRDVDPLLAARGFLGMFVYHFMVQELFGGKKYQDLDIDNVSETLTDIWLRGMMTEASVQVDESAQTQSQVAGASRSRAKRGANGAGHSQASHGQASHGQASHGKAHYRTAGHATPAAGNGHK
jgi:TetR/AcrR family transcriptional regulator